MKLFIFIAFQIVILMSTISCGTHSKKTEGLRLSTLQEGVSVYFSDDSLAGQTPLEFSKDTLEKHLLHGTLFLKLQKQGFQDQSLIASISEIKEISVDMKPLSDEHFNKWVLDHYSGATNKMLRELLGAQGLIYLDDYASAKKQLEAFAKLHPTLGAPLTMLAGIALKNNENDLARSLLLKAVSLDPSDSTASGLLKNLDQAVIP